MVFQDTLRQLTRDHRSDRERAAEGERIALQARAVRALPSERPSQAALLGRLLAVRRYALQ